MWNITTSQDTANTVYTRCFDVSITSQKNSIALENAYPITDEQGKKLTAFNFTITNTCDIAAIMVVHHLVILLLRVEALPSFLDIMDVMPLRKKVLKII